MKWIRFCSAVVATIGLTTAVQASTMTLSHGGTCAGAAKSCGCAPSCQPVCCKPTIEIPCEPNVFTYQRQKSCLKPPVCHTCPAPVCCAPTCCAPKKSCCLGGGKSCLSGLFGGHKGCGLLGCKKQGCCAPAAPCCEAAPVCAAPAPTCNTCAAPAPTCCEATPCCQKKSCLSGLFGGHKGCGLFSGKGCNLFKGHKGWGLFGCKQKKGLCEETRIVCCPVDPCELAALIYKSQTACYADDREDAIEELGETYSCLCNPEIMAALIYGLNDAVESVREEAAEQIGKQLEENPCCCSPEVTSALTCALGDCDDGVVDAATTALEACGYCVVEGCCCAPAAPCSTCGTVGGCANGQCGVGGVVHPGIPVEQPAHPEVAPPPAVDGEAAPAPAPPEEPKAYYPSNLRQRSAGVPARNQNKLANLFGLRS